jgi:hypothetical protein
MIDTFLKNLWLWKCGLDEAEPVPPLDTLRERQMSKRFITLMENRMIMGYFRYGDWRSGNQGKTYDRVGSMITRLKAFQQDGNLEHLVDVANLAMIEFEISDHPNAHFKAQDDGEHVTTKTRS